MKKKVSVVLATYNEETNIERCLMSLYDLADEIIIIDGTSTDSTCQKARDLDHQNKITISRTENQPNFHKLKRMGLQKATCEWIFQIDADEALSDALKKEIAAVIQSGSAHNGYWVPRLNFFLGRPLRKGGQYPDQTIRLYKNGKGMLAAKSVHEQADIQGSIGLLQSDLLHYPYPTFEMYIAKWVRYASLEAHAAYASGVRPTIWGFISMCFIRPFVWFVTTYVRHKGFQDGIAGWVFSFFSGLRFCAEFILLYELSIKGELDGKKFAA